MKTRQDPWTVADVPDQKGRTAVVTGANTGIGFEAAAVLAQRGAVTVLACRDTGKAERAAARLSAATPDVAVSVVRLDLGSLDSIRAAAEQIRAGHERIDLLINNAGVMMPPHGTTRTASSCSSAPTTSVTSRSPACCWTGCCRWRGRGWSRSAATATGPAGSTSTTSSPSAATAGSPAYGQSKLANLMFTYELQRRLRAAEAATIALAAHPGTAHTELTRHLPGLLQTAQAVAGGLFTQSATMGALPTLRAATDPAVRGGEYYGPGGWGQMTGYPVQVSSNSRSHDEAAQQRLWAESERITGVTYPV